MMKLRANPDTMKHQTVTEQQSKRKPIKIMRNKPNQRTKSSEYDMNLGQLEEQNKPRRQHSKTQEKEGDQRGGEDGNSLKP